MQRGVWLVVPLVLAACSSMSAPPLRVTQPPPVARAQHVFVAGARVSSMVATARVDGRLVAYVADEDDAMLRVFDVDAERALGALKLPKTPSAVITLPHARVAVAFRDLAAVVVYEDDDGGEDIREIATIAVPVEPVALARTPDDASIVVTSGWGHALSIIDGKTFERRATIELGREPRGVVVSADGSHAFVNHAAGDGLSIVDLEHAEARPKVWNLEAESWQTFIARFGPQGPFSRRSNNGYAIALSEEPAGRVFVPHALAHTTANGPSGEEEQVSGYGGGSAGPNELFDVAVIDVKRATPMDFEQRPSGENVLARLADDSPRVSACVVPRAAAVLGATLFVACLDTHRVLALDAGFFHPHAAVLGFVDVPLGPTGIAVDAEGQRVVVWSQFARQLTVIAATGAPITLASIRVPAERPVDSAVARGRELFFGFDKRISGDGRVCASCHPDGRDDGLVWTTPDGPRQTPMLAGRLDGSAPYGWTGASRDVHTHLTKTFARLGGSGLGGADKDALVAFVKSMQAPRAAKVDAAVAKRGKAIFESEQAACSSCHGDAGDLPDGERHNVRSWAKGDVIGLFDTPSLRGVGGTAPYFHDGRYRTLHQLLSRVDGTMGHTKQLSPDDMNDLETYLRTL